MTQYLKGVLESNNIACLLRNEYLSGGAGELPINETWPELWVLNDEDLPRARELVDAALAAGKQPARAWVCPRCGELLEGQFEFCWNCGAEREQQEE